MVRTAEVQIANAEFRAFDVHWQEYLTASGEVLDITVAAVLGTTRDSPSTLFADFLLDFSTAASNMYALCIWGQGHDTSHVRA
jgi:hypothetical protein